MNCDHAPLNVPFLVISPTTKDTGALISPQITSLYLAVLFFDEDTFPFSNKPTTSTSSFHFSNAPTTSTSSYDFPNDDASTTPAAIAPAAPAAPPAADGFPMCREPGAGPLSQSDRAGGGLAGKLGMLVSAGGAGVGTTAAIWASSAMAASLSRFTSARAASLLLIWLRRVLEWS